MPNLATLADRVLFAIHCLPRDEKQRPPSMRSLEHAHGIATATIKGIVDGTRASPRHPTMLLLAQALNVTTEWLYNGGDDDAPTPTGPIPPRLVPSADAVGGFAWLGRHGELPKWNEAVEEARATMSLPRGAYRAGANMPLWRNFDEATARMAYAISLYAWETSSRGERTMFATAEVDAEIAKRPSSRPRAARLRMK